MIPTSPGAVPGHARRWPSARDEPATGPPTAVDSALPLVVNGRLVGRDAELSWLRDQLDLVGHGSAETVLIGGDAGIGKTRLVTEFGRDAAGHGISVLSGGCLDRGDIPYAPMVAALRDELSRRGADRVRALLPELGVSVLESLLPGRLVPSVRHLPRSQATSQTMIFESLLYLLEALSRPSPVVLVLEDMHWADQSSLDLLSFLARSLREHPVLVLATYRSTDLLPDHPLRSLIGELRRLPRCVHLDLRPLPTSAVESLLSDLTGARAGDPQTHRIVELAAGNPFFVEELALAPALPSVVPDSVRDHALARVQLLDDDSREVVSAAAVHDSTIPHDLLAEVSGLPTDRLVRALESCFAHHLLDQDPSGRDYRFRHPLIREVVYRQLLPGRRLRLHAAVARTLQRWMTGSHRVQPSATDLAHHWWEADAPAQALRWCLPAAESAAAVFAVSEAVRWYERVLQLWPTVNAGDRPSEPPYDVVLLRAADASRWAGDLDTATDYLDAALELLGSSPDPERRAQLLERKGRFLWEAGAGAASLDAYEQACTLVRDRPASPATAWVLAGRGTALMQGGQHREAIVQCREALAIAVAAGAQAAQGRALNTLGVCLALTGEPEEGTEALHRAASLATATRSLEEIHRTYANLAYVLEGAGHLAPALSAARKGSALSSALAGQLSGSSVLMINAASVLVLLGRWAEADDQLAQARASSPSQAYIAIVQAEADIARGRWAQAAEQLHVARGSGLFDSEPQFAGAVLAAQAELALWQRDPLPALHAVEDGLDALHGSLETACELRLCWLGARAVADARVTPSPGPDLAERLIERVDVFRGDPVLGTFPDPATHAQTCLAELARWRGEAGADLWENVASAWTALRRPYPAAYARFRAGEVALTGRDHARATKTLVTAYAESERLGAEPLRREIESLATRSRVRLVPEQPRKPSPSPYGLTRREREVLAQLVLGRTNRQIARTLFISEKTAGTHVSNLMAKLGVTNRGEAAAVAHRLKLVPDPEPIRPSP